MDNWPLLELFIDTLWNYHQNHKTTEQQYEKTDANSPSVTLLKQLEIENNLEKGNIDKAYFGKKTSAGISC